MYVIIFKSKIKKQHNNNDREMGSGKLIFIFTVYIFSFIHDIKSFDVLYCPIPRFRLPSAVSMAFFSREE